MILQYVVLLWRDFGYDNDRVSSTMLGNTNSKKKQAASEG